MFLLWVLLFGAGTASGLPTSDFEFGQQTPLGFGQTPKRIAIVGAGAAGISHLKAIAELPEDIRRGWEVVAFEERHSVGGVWLPDTTTPHPPEIPETPLYPSLRTNGPHPFMTIPHVPFPPETVLLPSHQQVLKYHEGVVAAANVSGQIRLQHSVSEAKWVGSSTEGRWNLIIEDRARRVQITSQFDHLIVATGVNHFPHYPFIKGQDDFLAANRTIVHSMYFREMSDFDGKNVVVAGGGPSGWDIVVKLADHAKTLYWSRDTKEENPGSPNFPPVPGTTDRPRVAELTKTAVRFADDTEVNDIDVLILATGYNIRIPFLSSGGHLEEVARSITPVGDRLSTNMRYIRPLYEHVLSLDTSYPLGALYFNGLLTYNPTGVCTYAQALFAAYTIAEPALLQTRDELYTALLEREASTRAGGFDPAQFGHRVVPGYGGRDGTPYQDVLVQYLQKRGLAGQPGIPPSGVNFTEQWRTYGLYNSSKILDAWKSVQGMGEEYEKEWVKGTETEEDYADMMTKLVKWWEKENGEGGLTMDEI
ncbi:FAD/NAD(P)-binding domain-containing protein [Amylostereum chailletii]|nr:FAD/NAD(P)-binding domain-containing protein [Amylostereum chailletii]